MAVCMGETHLTQNARLKSRYPVAEIFGFGFIALLPGGQIVVNFPLETLEPVTPRTTSIPAIANELE
jgi:hypothetical protein